MKIGSSAAPNFVISEPHLGWRTRRFTRYVDALILRWPLLHRDSHFLAAASHMRCPMCPQTRSFLLFQGFRAERGTSEINAIPVGELSETSRYHVRRQCHHGILHQLLEVSYVLCIFVKEES
jgi:hypothetical protein